MQIPELELPHQGDLIGISNRNYPSDNSVSEMVFGSLLQINYNGGNRNGWARFSQISGQRRTDFTPQDVYAGLYVLDVLENYNATHDLALRLRDPDNCRGID